MTLNCGKTASGLSAEYYQYGRIVVLYFASDGAYYVEHFGTEKRAREFFEYCTTNPTLNW